MMNTDATRPPVDDLAPTPVEELNPALIEEDIQDEDEEGEGGEGGKKSGGGGKKPAAAIPALKDDEDLSAYDSESLIEKLKMLVWAPFSAMVPGASSFESETDLKRKLFLGQIGLITNQIDPHDIADPELINRLEARNQERQAQYKAEILAATGAAAGMAAGLSAETAPPENKKEQRREQKAQISQPKEISLDARQELRDDADETKVDAKQDLKTDFAEAEYEDAASEMDMDAKQGDFAREKPKREGMELDDIADLMDRARDNMTPETDNRGAGLEAIASIATAFNALASQTEYTQPEQKIDLRFADPAPKMEMGGGGMGV